MKKLWNLIKDLPVQIFGASMGVIAMTVLAIIFCCMIASAVVLVYETSSFVFRIINLGLKHSYNILSVEYQSNNILFIKYVCILFVAFILFLLLCGYIYKYKRIKKSVSHFYIPYGDLTEAQRKLIPELFEQYIKSAYFSMKHGVVSLNTILKDIKQDIAKHELLHPSDVRYILHKIPYQKYEDLGKSMSLLEWLDYYTIQKEIGLDNFIEDLSYQKRDLITVNVPIIKQYFIDSVKHGTYNEESIITDIDKRFCSILKVLSWQDRRTFLSLIPNLCYTDDGVSYTLHEYLEYAKEKNPDYIEGSIFNKE